MSIYASWQTEKSIVKIINRNFDGHEERWAEVEERVKLYARGDNPFKDVINPSESATPPFKVDVALALAGGGARSRPRYEESFLIEVRELVAALSKVRGRGFLGAHS